MSTLPPPRETPADLLRPRTVWRDEDGTRRPALLWRAGPGWRMASSALLGGGIGERAWVLNLQVRPGYDRMDPVTHLTEVAAPLGLTGAGVGLMTAAEVTAWTHGADEGAEAAVTTGIGVPTWAAAPVPGLPGAPPPGTINIIAAVPATLSDAALINAVATITEAKVQALLDAGYACTGTPSDAICVAARVPTPNTPTEPFGGPRSTWGARLARAVYTAVLQGARNDHARRQAPTPPKPRTRTTHPLTRNTNKPTQ
ncbi:adenosylcobinamide amidohydrolase [Embleya scabrispora]|uniref:adenosylcobinamide amidohydrolase n=1 Tax=Embleya scabrispora TaxID=159449 RepID=UPI00036436FF|nr:adenosylcobinamide amidohydrolase [Embleya scabrispora]